MVRKYQNVEKVYPPPKNVAYTSIYNSKKCMENTAKKTWTKKITIKPLVTHKMYMDLLYLCTVATHTHVSSIYLSICLSDPGPVCLSHLCKSPGLGSIYLSIYPNQWPNLSSLSIYLSMVSWFLSSLNLCYLVVDSWWDTHVYVYIWSYMVYHITHTHMIQY